MDGAKAAIGRALKRVCCSAFAREGARGVLGGYPDSPLLGDRGAESRSALRHPRHRGSRGVALALEPSAPAAGAAREDVRVMEQAIEQRGDGRGVAEELAPILDGAVRGDEG